ncbi:MAG: phage head-tail connector protein [Hyphomicrobiaceae bacterium]|nr:phage head-tail connector protein [Hyphomicrobiaceae bacterium]
MALMMRNAPLGEPLTLDQVKLHLRLDGAGEDTLLASLILTSRLHIEAALGLALISQGWRLVLDAWPADGALALPISPVQGIEEIRVRDRDGNSAVVSADDYELAAAGRPQRLVRRGAGWPPPGRPVAGIEIDLVAGFGTTAEDVPAPIRQALMLLVAHWYEHRDPFEIGAPQTHVPGAVSRLLGPYRPVRL